MSFVESIQLTNFRSYASVALDGLPSGPVVLYGSNGVGENECAGGVVVPVARAAACAGRKNLRKSRSTTVSATASRGRSRRGCKARSASVNLGTGADSLAERRLVRINGEAAKSQAAMAEYLSCAG